MIYNKHSLFFTIITQFGIYSVMNKYYRIKDKFYVKFLPQISKDLKNYEK